MGPLLIGLLGLAQPPVAPATCVQLAAPSYVVPGQAWSALLETPALRQAVINPASGAGPAPDPAYAEVVRDGHRAGVRMLGYLPTRYGTRDAMEVLAEAEDYLAWYGVDGFFVDETTSGPSGIDYYAGLAAALRERGAATLALNPGAVPDERYMWIGDQVVVFEGPAAAYAKLSMPPWAQSYAPERFWAVVYGVDLARGSDAVVERAVANRVGLLWATNDADGNPYDSVPPRLEAVAQLCTSATQPETGLKGSAEPSMRTQ